MTTIKHAGVPVAVVRPTMVRKPCSIGWDNYLRKVRCSMCNRGGGGELMATCPHDAGSEPGADLVELIGALREMVYETTHLSPQEDDGSHICKISADALSAARAALAKWEISDAG